MIKNKLGTLGLALVPLVIGLLVGLAVPVDFIRDRVAGSLEMADAHEDDGHNHAGPPDAAGETDHVELTATSQQSMGLQTGRIAYQEYQSTFDLPAFVREIPGASDLHVSSRFAGLVKRVFISEGQTVRPGQPVLEIDLTGDLLATAQSELLDALQQISIVEQEITRLEPTVRSGGVANKTLIQKKYDRDLLAAKVETKSQELLVRGISQPQIDEMIGSKKLLRTVTITVPENLIPPQLNAGGMLDHAPEAFVVERLLAKPGTMTNVGDSICELSFHAVVVVEGQAYEKDLPRIRQAISDQVPLHISIGPDGLEEHIPHQRIAFLSNHVDAETNTYPFYLYLNNESLVQTAYGDQDTNFISWKWKPGQRAHVEVPDQQFQKCVVIRAHALAIDGLNHYVFRWMESSSTTTAHEDEPMEPEEDDHELLDEYQAIEVVVRHMDRYHVVIEKGDRLNVGDRIAFNNAGQLLFAMQAGSGGGHDHHDHSH